MSGPAKRPLALVRLEGNPGKRKLPKAHEEIKVAPVAPDCPDWLDAVAKAEWARVVPLLTIMGLVGKIDRTALAAYCQSYSRWVEAEKALSKEGTTIAMESGYSQVTPNITIAHKYLDKVKSFCAEFGMTPSARARMSIPGKKEDDEFDTFLKDVQ
jgi:P27 family predicted phage terminase small subunit